VHRTRKKKVPLHGRCIPFTKLKSDDFVSKRETGVENALFKQTEEAKLGAVHVFASHSWSDDGKAKYQVLQRWCEKEKNATGEEVTVWLDKAYIDQTNITESLICLPVFLAGCQKLLIVAGRTHAERLWCIIEVFTFLTMGGDASRIEVVAIDMDKSDAKAQFESVDISQCECYDQRDKEKLLGLVEAAFGNYDKFNRVLRTVFNERACGSLVKGQSERWKKINQVRPNSPCAKADDKGGGGKST
jgi:hypothetical protein